MTKQEHLNDYFKRKLDDVKDLIDDSFNYPDQDLRNEIIKDNLENLCLEFNKVVIDGVESGWPSIDIWKEENADGK
jgi:lipopolysaccharide biosynthesis glycosyltransferase